MSHILQEAVKDSVEKESGELVGNGGSHSFDSSISVTNSSTDITDKQPMKAQLTSNSVQINQLVNSDMKHTNDQGNVDVLNRMIKDNSDVPIRNQHNRTSLITMKSVPVGKKESMCAMFKDHRRVSNSEIFLFPDVSGKSEIKQLSSNMIERNKNTLQSKCEPIEQGISSVQAPLKGPEEFLKNFIMSTPGISEQYFTNMINELAKTKKYLYCLQMQDRLNDESFSAMLEKIQKLQVANKHLQRKLEQSDEQLQLRKSASPAPIQAILPLKKDDSFEIEDVESKEKANKKCYAEAEKKFAAIIEELKSSNQELLKERDQLKKQVSQESIAGLTSENLNMRKEIEQLMDEYSQLKSSVKMMSQCLQEEKVKTRDTERLLKKKMDEVTKLVEQLGRLRQQHEELNMEKKALEKTICLFDDSSGYQSSHNRRRSSDYIYSEASSSTREHHYTAASPCQSGQPTTISATSFTTSFSGPYFGPVKIPFNIAPENTSAKPNQCNVSSKEEKVLNLPNSETESLMLCPRCWQTFNFEQLYFKHLNKCIE